MASDIVTKILERTNLPDLLSLLSNNLTGSELNSILLKVFNQKTRSLTPPELLNQYQVNRFVKPADLPVIEVKRMELEILELFRQWYFQPIELSPVTILGSCSVVATADQNKVVSALRGTEVLADSTNAIALHACDLKQRKLTKESQRGIWLKCSNIQRQVRAQTISVKGFTPHFKIGCLVTCGRDNGGYEFEKHSLHEHMQIMKMLFIDYYKVDGISFRLLARGGYPENFLRDTGDFLSKEDPDTQITIVDQPEKEIAYYKGIQYKVDIRIHGKTYEIADGGFVDWTQQYLQNTKERMLSTGFGFDLMFRILSLEL